MSIDDYHSLCYDVSLAATLSFDFMRDTRWRMAVSFLSGASHRHGLCSAYTDIDIDVLIARAVREKGCVFSI